MGLSPRFPWGLSDPQGRGLPIGVSERYDPVVHLRLLRLSRCPEFFRNPQVAGAGVE